MNAQVTNVHGPKHRNPFASYINPIHNIVQTIEVEEGMSM